MRRGPRLTKTQVLEIRQDGRAGVPIGDIATKFGLGIKATRKILLGQAWAELVDPAGAGPVEYVATRRRPTARRPQCPSCKGFIEADINPHRGIFLQCEKCSRTWSALVTPEERAQRPTGQTSIQEEQQAESPSPQLSRGMESPHSTTTIGYGREPKTRQGYGVEISTR